ncbi:MAG: serine hydrolase [Gemmatimonadota bacterium]
MLICSRAGTALLVIATGAGCAGGSTSPPGAPQAIAAASSSGAVTSVADRVARLEAAIPRLLAEGDVPGLSIALIEKGQVAWTHAFGFANADTKAPVTERTVFEAASLSKPVVAYVALHLVDAGRLDLDAPLSRYVTTPYVADDPRLAAITARRVLSHTSGLPNGRGPNQPEQIYFPPGERFSYSGEGFLYLQKVIETITGQPLNAIAQQLVFDPFGMVSSSFVWQNRYDSLAAFPHNDAGVPGDRRKPLVALGHASLETTAADYARFITALVRGSGLKTASRSAMFRLQSQVDSTCVVCTSRPAGPKLSTIGWGLGWGLSPVPGGDTLFWHWGDNGNMKAFTATLVRAGRGVVFFTNGANGLGIAPDIAAVALGIEAPAFRWLSYERYNAPSRTVLKDIVARGEPAVHDLLATPDRFTEAELNTLGYRLLGRRRPSDAVAVLRLNAERFPSSPNTHDSLGEAYLRFGDTTSAVKEYRRALELDPSQQNAADVLRRLGRQ